MSRCLVSAAFSLVWLLVLQTFVQAQQQKIEAVTSIGFPVSNAKNAVAFFTQVLDFEVVTNSHSCSEDKQTTTLKLGDETIELLEYPTRSGRPYPSDAHSNDRWFQHIAIVVSDMDQAYARLQKHRVKPLSQGPQRLPEWNKAAAGISAYYFADPDGHPLEIIHFPSGKGDPRWQRTNNRLFLGIDHTAIVVRDTESSLRFYRDQLGFQIAGTSENYGIEQERLNNVQGARLRITTLRASRGPGIELLEYLKPQSGRPYPSDTKPSDLWRWHINLQAAKAKPNTLPDPDGHVLHIEPTSR